jgi:hypothetical protein
MNLNNQYNNNINNRTSDEVKNLRNFASFKDLNLEMDNKLSNNLFEKKIKWKGIALWLIENTAINFEHIANFCGLHILQIEALANDEIDENIKPINPIAEGIVEKETIDACNNDPNKPISFSVYNNLLMKLSSQDSNARYTTITKKKNKPDAIAWILKNYPFISDAQIIKLIGTTKNTINSIRNKTYKGMKTLKPRSPVILSLCTNEQFESVIMNSKILYDRIQIENNDTEDNSFSENKFNFEYSADSK